MAYLAIARQWRPQRFEDLVGQDHVVQTLKNAIRLERVTHAYLFSGARGVGKTSVARIFAKALRCPNAVEAVPCQTCTECQAISEGRSVDVVEIDGASNNGVESVRSIRENVSYGASSGKYKIYIIDEVHMLSISAFNALLKTLEEPPPHVIFVFATTEVQKIPLTILSRCQRFEFRRLTTAQTVSRLQTILASEKLPISEPGLRLIASLADGSLRDALSLLDQVLSYSGQAEITEPLSEEKVVQALGIHDSGSIRALLAAVFQKQVTQGLKIVEENYLSGIDLKNFAERFLEEMRLLYLLVAAQESKVEISAEDLDISSGHLSGLKVVAEPLGLIRVERAIQILSKAIQQMTWSHLPRLILEMAVVRIANLDQLEKVEAAILENRRGEESPLQQSESPSSLRSEAEANLPPPAPPMPHMPVMSPPPPARPAPQAGEQNWKNFVEHVMRKRPLLGALLSHANFKLEDKGGAKKIILAFPSGGFYERQAKDSKSDIADQVKGFFGDKIEFILSSDLENTNTSIEQSNQAYETELKQKSKEHPAVLSWKQATGAEVVDVKLEQ